MTNRCNKCALEFGLFRKERGCKNCGFAFCSKCLHEKTVPIPRLSNEKHHVCRKCYDILTSGKKQEPKRFEVPDTYLKRMAALKEKEADKKDESSSSTAASSQNMPQHIRKLPKADQDIALRLQKLKSRQPEVKTTEKEIQERLARLKGSDSVPESKPSYKPPDRRTQTQQVDELLNEIAAEVEIDSHAPDPVLEVEARLEQLRRGKPQAQGHISNENNLNKSEPKRSSVNYLPNNIAAASGEEGENMDEMERLMAQVATECQQDAHKALEEMKTDQKLMDKLREIQNNKKHIRSSSSDSNSDNTNEDLYSSSKLDNFKTENTCEDEDDDLLARKIIQKYLEEATLDEAANFDTREEQDSKTNSKQLNKKSCQNKESDLPPSTIKPPTKEELVDSDYDDPDELPFCSICTEDARIRCLDCDMDLYCCRCFKECHQELSIMDHRNTPYKPPKGYR